MFLVTITDRCLNACQFFLPFTPAFSNREKSCFLGVAILMLFFVFVFFFFHLKRKLKFLRITTWISLFNSTFCCYSVQWLRKYNNILIIFLIEKCLVKQDFRYLKALYFFFKKKFKEMTTPRRSFLSLRLIGIKTLKYPWPHDNSFSTITSFLAGEFLGKWKILEYKSYLQ